MKPNTPPLRTSGRFTVLSPFTLTADMTYTCDAVFTFKDLAVKGIDIFTAYYEPIGLTLSDFTRDKKAGAAIVTLVAADSKVEFVPDTYIGSYPGLSTIKYSHNVAVVELGLLPDTVDIKTVGDSVAALIRQRTGAEVTMKLSTVDYDGEVTSEMHTSMDTARKAVMRSSLSPEVTSFKLEARNLFLEQEVIRLTDIVKKIKSGEL